MSELQTFPLTVTDERGRKRTGVVAIASEWDRAFEALSDEFVIVLLETAGAIPSTLSPRVCVCLPGSSGGAVGEAQAAYVTQSAGGGIGVGRNLSAYASGRIVCGAPIRTDASEVFAEGGRLELLALDIVRSGGFGAGATPFVEALRSLMRTEEPFAALGLLLERVAGKDAPPSAEAGLRRLEAAVERSFVSYSGPEEIVEDAVMARCIDKGIAGVEEVAAMREYLRQAIVPETMAELAVDRTVTFGHVSFAILFAEPHRLAEMSSAFQLFRDRYRQAYERRHRSYHATGARLASRLEDLVPQAVALRRLNALGRLGPALGQLPLARYGQLSTVVAPCQAGGRLGPWEALCPECGVTLADEPRSREAELIAKEVRKALSQQLSRLSGEAVKLVLRRGGERIDRFLDAVQASDLSGLVAVLDDDMLAFLGALLAEAADD